MREALERYLGEPITELARIGTGHSRAMYRVTTTSGDRVVVRIEQGGVFGTTSAEEFGVMQALHRAGFPVARVRGYERDPSVLGQPFFVMDYIDGGRTPEDGERAVDATTAAAFVRTLHQLHQLDWEAAQVRFAVEPADPDEATHRQIDRWAGIAAAEPRPSPLLEEAAAWLHRCAPPLDRLSIVHSDAGPGNFVHTAGQVLAVTDWEFAHLGDPAEDWAYCAVMRGSSTMSRDAWIELYRSEAGVELSPGQWRYWEAFNLFKGACANRTTLQLLANGANRAPNMVIIGAALHQVFLRRLVDLVGDEP